MEESRVSSVMGWFRQRFGKQKAELNQDGPRNCSLKTFSGQSSSTSSRSSSPAQTLPSLLSSPLRLAHPYDVCLCHSQNDSDLAQSLASFLEQPTKGLRCFLQERDCPAGGAVSTELLQAVHDSHCWVLLVSPDFLKDEWCLYQMHQMLSEGPMSQRLIPAVMNMPRSGLPLELRFLFTVDLNTNMELGFNQVYRTVLHNLKDVCKSEQPGGASPSDGSDETPETPH